MALALYSKPVEGFKLKTMKGKRTIGWVCGYNEDMGEKHVIKLKRVYEKPDKSDGFRILVDRLWPRGLSKEKAQVDLWLKDIAPSNELRKWFGHDPAKWTEFQHLYKRELENKQEVLEELKQIIKEKNITLLYSARDTKHNNAVVLKELLELQM